MGIPNILHVVLSKNGSPNNILVQVVPTIVGIPTILHVVLSKVGSPTNILLQVFPKKVGMEWFPSQVTQNGPQI